MFQVLARTKYFHRFKPSPVKTRENKFNSVCGHFFFGLLAQFDKPLPTLRLLSEDSQIFCNLLYTLGIIVHHSANSPMLSKMVETLMGEFCGKHLSHPDGAVRQSVWFCILISLVSMNSQLLVADDTLLNVFMSYQLKAMEVINADPHGECRQLANQFLSAFQNVIRNNVVNSA